MIFFVFSIPNILCIIFSVNIEENLKKQRQILGLSQSSLAQLSGLSLASIQNMEAGKANLSISNLASLLEVLGFDLKLVRRQVEWEKLISYGLPILPANPVEKQIGTDLSVLESLLVNACAEFIQRDGQKNPRKHLREREALESMMFAIKSHFPSFYKGLERYKAVLDLTPEVITGKHIKLRRIALENLREVL
ncbi:MAG: helix-turn-helix domain-containing protein [Bdellovibrionales bacterium]